MKEELKLLNCPFCGSDDIDPEFCLRLDAVDCVDSAEPGCNNCGATASSVEKWNTRTRPTDAGGVVNRAVAAFNEYALLDNLHSDTTTHYKQLRDAIAALHAMWSSQDG